MSPAGDAQGAVQRLYHESEWVARWLKRAVGYCAQALTDDEKHVEARNPGNELMVVVRPCIEVHVDEHGWNQEEADGVHSERNHGEIDVVCCWKGPVTGAIVRTVG